MSIRTNGSGDHLALTASFGITTGAFSFGYWVKVINTRASTFVDFVGLMTEEADATSYISTGTDDSNPPLFKAFDNITGGVTYGPLNAATAGTWFWATIVRSGTTVTFATFDDTTSTTPVSSASQTGAGSITTLDWLIIGQAFGGASPEWPDAEFANAKIHAGIAWTNAQSRAESQHSAAQTGGGTFVVACSLQSLAVGLSNTGTLGGSLTNTGCVDGASNPTQLTFDGGVVADPCRLVTAIRTVA